MSAEKLNMRWILEENEVNDGAFGVEASSGDCCITHADPIGGDMEGGENAGSALAEGVKAMSRAMQKKGMSIACVVWWLRPIVRWSRQPWWFMQTCRVFI